MLHSPLQKLDSQVWETLTGYLGKRQICILLATGSHVVQPCLAAVRQLQIEIVPKRAYSILLMRLLRLNLKHLTVSGSESISGHWLSIASSKLTVLSFRKIQLPCTLHIPPTLTSLELGHVKLFESIDFLNIGEARLVHFGVESISAATYIDSKQCGEYLFRTAILPFADSIESLNLGICPCETKEFDLQSFEGLRTLSAHVSWIKNVLFPPTITYLDCHSQDPVDQQFFDAIATFGTNLTHLNLDECEHVPLVDVHSLQNLRSLWVDRTKLIDCHPTQSLSVKSSSVKDIRSAKMHNIRLSQNKLMLESGQLPLPSILTVLNWRSLKRLGILYEDLHVPLTPVDYGCLKNAVNLEHVGIQNDFLAAFHARGGLDFFRNVSDLDDLTWTMSLAVANRISTSTVQLAIHIRHISLRVLSLDDPWNCKPSSCFAFDWIAHKPNVLKLNNFAVCDRMFEMASSATSEFEFGCHDSFTCQHCRLSDFAPSPHLKSLYISFSAAKFPKMSQLSPSLCNHVKFGLHMIHYERSKS